MTVSRYEPDPAYKRLTEQVEAMTNAQLGGLQDYLAKNPNLPEQLVGGGSESERAAAEAVIAMGHLDLYAAMAKAGMPPPNSPKAMTEALQTMVRVMMELRRLPAEVELAIAKATIERARLEAQAEIEAATFRNRKESAVVRSEIEREVALYDQAMKSSQSRVSLALQHANEKDIEAGILRRQYEREARVQSDMIIGEALMTWKIRRAKRAARLSSIPIVGPRPKFKD
ncbi:Uncharacterised protein [Mycobacteroides abscessus subsp. abscessus]|nr:Uncharacterised protein [Mycobacteroides abscessus subsp. abscessus]